MNDVPVSSGLRPLEFLRQEADHRHLDGGERSGPLGSIERLADATIGRARLHDLLREVLERTRDVFGADAALIFLVRSDGDGLDVADSSGLDEQAVPKDSIPMGVGFVGRIAASGEASIVDDVAGIELARPLLKRGIRSVMGAPILSPNGSEVVGVIDVGSCRARRFGDDDVALLRHIAAQISLVVGRSQIISASEDGSRFRTLASFAPVGIYQTDSRGCCEFVNEGWCRIAGMTPDQAHGTGWFSAIHPDDRSRIVQAWLAAAQENAEFSSRHRYLSPHGAVTWVQERARPLRDGSGTVRGYIGTITDVTEQQKRVRQSTMLARAGAVLASSIEYELTLENVMTIVLPELADFGFFDVVEPDGNVRRVARAYNDPRRQAILSATQFVRSVGTDINVCALSSGRPALHADIDDEWLLKVASDDAQLELMHSLAFRSMVTVPLVYDRKVLGALTLFYGDSGRRYSPEDVGFAEALAQRVAAAVQNARLYRDLKAREEEAKRAFESAREAHQRKDEFLAMLSHELRNPLSPILTALELLKMQGADRTSKEYAIIGRQVRHLVRLVDDLLDVSRITRGKIELRRRRVECNEFIAKAIELAAPLLECRHHELVNEVPATGLVVNGDEHRLAQVMSNLLTNAAKYTEPGGRVSIKAFRDGECAVVTVSDSGSGIAPEALPRVFDLFSQSAQTLDRAQGGLGLGLAIVKSIVELHDGRVMASSAGVGMGSTFEVRLPLASPARDTERPREDWSGTRPIAASGKRILIVDDNRDVADLLVEALSAKGHITRAAYDGPTALALAETFRPQIGILDIGLPVMDGYELSMELGRRFGDSIQLVALTGYGQAHDVKRSKEVGFREHLVKPVPLERLTAIIDGLACGDASGPC